MTLRVLNSKLDDTTNHVYDDGSEFRLVQRADHATIYLSSHTGCALACKMCHLTATGQTKMKPLLGREMVNRVKPFLYEAKGRINFSFMARGDALANPHVDGEFSRSLLWHAPETQHAKICISTIFPRKAVGEDVAGFLFKRFGPFQPALFWSVYSVKAEVRQEWLPEAQDLEVVARGLSEWQKATFQTVTIHQSLIKGVNDSFLDATNIATLVTDHDLRVKVNLVRYNPPAGSDSVEADEEAYQMHLRIYREAFGASQVKLQPRVGYDVSASCGMFESAGAIGG